VRARGYYYTVPEGDGTFPATGATPTLFTERAPVDLVLAVVRNRNPQYVVFYYDPETKVFRIH
jgi:hypothetical protein